MLILIIIIIIKYKIYLLRLNCLKKLNNYIDEYKNKNIIIFNNYLINDLIFVSIASFRDSDCHKTIKSLIYKSKNWKNLRICVCQQNDINDIDCLYNLHSKYHSIIEIINLNYLDAKGPTKARYLIQQKYKKEQYYLQIDSHTRFKKNWDYKLKKTLNKLPPKSCLTQYLPEYNNKKLRGSLKVININTIDSFTRINSNYSLKSKKIFISNSWSASFSFSMGDICIDAPIDPYTPNLFFGEELDITLRLYTRNWNFYSPNYLIAFTNFDRSYRKTFWENDNYNKYLSSLSRLRVHYRLGTLPTNIKLPDELIIDSNKYSLGNNKTLTDYENLIGFKIIY